MSVSVSDGHIAQVDRDGGMFPSEAKLDFADGDDNASERRDVSSSCFEYGYYEE